MTAGERQAPAALAAFANQGLHLRLTAADDLGATVLIGTSPASS